MTKSFRIADVRPIGNRVLIRRDPDVTTYGSGVLYRPEVYHGQRQTGTVIRCGPGVLNPRDGTYHPPEVKPGDRVWFVPWKNEDLKGTTDVDPDEAEYTLLPADFIAAIVPSE